MFLVAAGLLQSQREVYAATTTVDVLVATGSLISRTTLTVEGTELSVGATSFFVANGTTTFGGLLRRWSSAAIGNNAATHVNLGNASATGEEAQNYSYSTVGGGFSNGAMGEAATVGGGNGNQATKRYATVGGGNVNQAFGEYSFIGGGSDNTAQSDYSVVAGGQQNKGRGYASTVPGGYANTAAGDYSFAAGQSAKATAKGAYVWADASTSAQLINSTTNQYYIRAQGGFYVQTTSVTFTGELNMAEDQGIALAGPGGTVTSASSITASSFFGDGSNLTGVTASNAVSKTGDTMTGQLTLAGATLTVQGSAFSVGGATFVIVGSSVGIRTSAPNAALDVGGSIQVGSGTAKSTFTSAGQLRMNGFGIQWADGSSSTSGALGLPGVAFLSVAQTFSQGNTFNSSVTVLGPGVFGGTAAVLGSAFSVGGSSFVVVGSSIGVRTSAPAAALDVSGSVQVGSGTAKSTFTASGQLQLNSFGITWADGSTSTSGALGVPNIAYLSSTQTFVGANTFGSAVTVLGPAVFGGTVTVQGNALGVSGSVSATSATLSGSGTNVYALTTSSGIHIVAGVLEWPDGTKSASASPGGGNVVLSATQTFGGINTMAGGVVIASSVRVNAQAFLEMNGPGDVNPLNTGNMVYWAKSIDGATQSSGCLVAVRMAGNSANSQMTFTSTTAIQNLSIDTVMAGILLETCAPAATCRIGLAGVYLVKTGAVGNTTAANFSTTRCSVDLNSVFDAYAVGHKVDPSSPAAGNLFWLRLDGPH